MSDPFEKIFGQPHVREFLRASVSNERVTQAYLFTGPAGSNKTQAAYALAKSLICENGGCGKCEACVRVERKTHPDVRFYAPQGSSGYLVEQIREIVADSSLAPIQADIKVYILDRVDLLGVAAANAFLKTLEEPPDDVVFILLGRTRESVLPTIVSRCSVVPFRHIPATEAIAIVTQKTGATAEQARIAIEACGGSMTRSIEFLMSSESRGFRQQVLEALSQIVEADSWDLLKMARDLTIAAKAPLDSVRAAQEAELAENADLLGKSALRQIEARHKRALSAKTIEAFRQLTAITASFLRDVLAVCAQTPDLVLNVDVRMMIEDAASRTDEARVAQALKAVETCASSISYNVFPETCISAMLLEIREALYGSNSPR